MRIVTVNIRRAYPILTGVFIALFAVFFLGLSFFTAKEGIEEAYHISASSEVDNRRVIILDAGHGGEDSGAIGADGTLEKDLNLAITMELGRQLSEEGYAVIYTRTEDRLLYTEAQNIKGMRKIYDLKNRCAVALDYPDAIFVSIHMNSFGDSRYDGLQVYYSTVSEGSAALAASIRDEVKEQLQPGNNRPLKAGKDLYLLENVQNPTVLVECGFISNPAECKKLSEKEYQKQLCFSIVCGIIKYESEMNGGEGRIQ